jgi:hypothetical protein
MGCKAYDPSGIPARSDPVLKGTVLLALPFLLLGLPWKWGEALIPGKDHVRSNAPLIQVELKAPPPVEGIYEVDANTTVGAFLSDVGLGGLGLDRHPWIWHRVVEDLTTVAVADGPEGTEIRVEPISQTKAFLLGAPMDLNRAGALDLKLLPGVGPVTARRIVAARGSRGAFSSLRDLGRFAGISQGLQERIGPLVTVNKEESLSGP